jgi:hypothetical protein
MEANHRSPLGGGQGDYENLPMPNGSENPL